MQTSTKIDQAASKQAFLNWLLWVKKKAPSLFALFKIKHPDIIEALDDKRLGFSFDWGSIANTAVKFVETALPIYQQQQQFKQQLQLAKLQITAPAQYQAVAAQQQAPQYQAVAVSPATPTTTTPPPTTPSGQQMLEIRIEKGQVPEVVQEAKNITGDLKQYLPYIGIGIGLFALATRGK